MGPQRELLLELTQAGVFAERIAERGSCALREVIGERKDRLGFGDTGVDRQFDAAAGGITRPVDQVVQSGRLPPTLQQQWGASVSTRSAPLTEASGRQRFGLGELGLGVRHPWWLDALAAKQRVLHRKQVLGSLVLAQCVHGEHAYSVHPVTLTTSL